MSANGSCVTSIAGPHGGMQLYERRRLGWIFVRGNREAHMKTCPDCNGDGVIEKGTDDEQQCPTCGGSGFVPDDDDDDEDVIKTVADR